MPIRVLHIVNKWAQGGVERFIENLVDGLDRGQYEQSILSVCTPVESAISCEKFGPLSSGYSLGSMTRGARRLGGFLDSHTFDVVHIHTNNSSGFLYTAISKRKNIPKRVIHSHNAQLGLDATVVKHLAHECLYKGFSGSETDRLACSLDAGVHLFRNHSFEIVPNGVDDSEFCFCEEERKRIRNSLGIADCEIVVGCVGSLIAAKNHRKSLGVFARFLKKRDGRLLIAGDGPQRDYLERIVTGMGIADKVTFLGYVKELSGYYSAMDVLLFPSFYEGLPMVLIEAQCNGLPILASDCVTNEAVMSEEMLKRLPLDASDSTWACSLAACKRGDPLAAVRLVKQHGFALQSTLEAVEKVYLQ